MPDESGRIRPISVPKVWPGHRDHVPERDDDAPKSRLRPHPFGFGAWEVIEDDDASNAEPTRS